MQPRTKVALQPIELTDCSSLHVLYLLDQLFQLPLGMRNAIVEPYGFTVNGLRRKAVDRMIRRLEDQARSAGTLIE